ncbi:MULTISPECIES: TonB-dependent receptor [unclassified Acidovorax]|uniref:TonB-dependent receptor n=1 Tax=unclassified Acidovorax TaxID=2684926 RepID=UPI001C47F54E|nr:MULTISPECIES: TonB-dependent receptor [unclassified Acidovorax]MBV7426710.1 TonB-dependent receptor [Acidovorax sp. sif0732]MBV7447835.1 TonB-dependent receptor [Acidovorax sp. sif0715]
MNPTRFSPSPSRSRAALNRKPVAKLTAAALAAALVPWAHAQTSQEPAAASASEAITQPARALAAVDVLGTTAPATRTPGERAAVTLQPGALPATVQQLNQDDIANTNVGRDISNIFRRVPGVLANNIDQGETGNGFRMRGFATQGTHGADTAVYVDGVPQNIPSSQGGAGHGPVFLEWLHADLIDGVDVIKGPISALYGDQNRAGAVDIRTRNGGSATPSSVSISAERHGLRRSTLVLSSTIPTSFSTIDSLWMADVYHNDGYRYASRTGRDTLFWKLSTQHQGARYSLRVMRYVADFDAPGYLLLPALEAGLDPRSTQSNNAGFGNARRTSLVFNRAPAEGEAGWYATAYAESLNRKRGITANATHHTVGVDDRHILGARVLHNTTFGNAAIAFGAELRKDRGDAYRQIYVNRAPSASYVNAQDLDLLTYGLFAQGQWRVTDTLKLSAGARYDRFDYDIANLKLPAASTGYDKGVFTPKLGASWSLTPQVELFANVAEGMRSPSAEQISSSGATGPLGATGGVISQIAPSKVRSFDLGFTASPASGWTVSGVGYAIQNSDEIVGQADGSFKSVGETTRKGLELEARWRASSATSVYASIGKILEAKVDNPAPNTGAKLTVPATQLKAGAQHKLRLGEGQLTLNADAYLIADMPYYVGTPATQERTMPLYTRYDLRATYDWKQTQLSLYATFQPHRYGTEIAYGSAAGLMMSPLPRSTFGATLRYFF